MNTDDSETRAVVLARTLQRRMVRTAHELHESAMRAAELCEQRRLEEPDAPEREDWDARVKYWRLAADRALEVARDWEEGPPLVAAGSGPDPPPLESQAVAADAVTRLAGTVVAALFNTVMNLQAVVSTAPDPINARLREITEEIDVAIRQIRTIIVDLGEPPDLSPASE
jgi:hypothetical protein